MAKSVLFVASVAKKHIVQFHLPFIKWFKERGYTVHVCAGNDFENGERPIVPYCDKYFIVPFFRSPVSRWNIVSYKRLKKLVQDNKYEMVHCHTPVAAAITRFALRKERKNGLKVLYTAHGFHFFKGSSLISGLYYLAEKLLAGYTDGLITINEEDYQAANKFCKNKGCEVFKIPGIGAQLDMIHNCTLTKQQLRKEFDIPDAAFTVMSNSEINANKNIYTSIDAAVKNPDIYLLICGSGNLLEDCRQYAARLCRENHCEGHIIFAGYRNDAKRLLLACDAFIFPSFREGLGMAAIEAMAAGLPIIVSDNRGTREYAVDGENAIVCPANDSAAFAEAISRLKNNPELCQKMGDAGRITAKRYDLPNAISAMSDIYRHFLPGIPQQPIITNLEQKPKQDKKKVGAAKL